MRDFETTARLRAWARRHPLFPSSPVVAAALAGTPAAIVGVYWLNTYVLHQPMPGEVATAAGALIGAAAAWVCDLLGLLLAKVRE